MEQLILKAIPRYRWTADKVVEGLDLKGKNIIVTGATSGIGIPTALALARTGANVTFTAREPSRGAKALEEIKQKSQNTNVFCKALDLSSYKSVVGFAHEWGSSPVDVLLHNAGVMASPYTLTEDGDEQQQQVNFYSVILLTEKLRPFFTEQARVVIVTSSAHKRVPTLGDMMTLFNVYNGPEKVKEADYNKWTSYAVAKSAALMYSNALNAEFEAAGKGLTSNALHPGGIMTGLQVSLSDEEKVALGWVDKDGNVSAAFKSVEEGASTSVWAAVSSELTGKGGFYLENCAVTPKDYFSPPSNDPNADILGRLMGTAPHVWNLDHCRQVATVGRDHLKSLGYLQ
jgi:NAD(P)-dependent dehydrogenase (short-subunit alcohol dehydrogenase family)